MVSPQAGLFKDQTNGKLAKLLLLNALHDYEWELSSTFATYKNSTLSRRSPNLYFPMNDCGAVRPLGYWHLREARPQAEAVEGWPRARRTPLSRSNSISPPHCQPLSVFQIGYAGLSDRPTGGAAPCWAEGCLFGIFVGC